ncbi:alpha/beta hydrolase [Kitasatospora sp. NPDC004669]|uniref:alpha/beta fold hydrolase n=1 Tax=Kitasatospora sp. NPDC004669 TaxID=3154555 RepID=UPI0033A596F8
MAVEEFTAERPVRLFEHAASVLTPLGPPPRPRHCAARCAAGERFAELRTITQPTLVVNGSNDIMVPTINSSIPAQNIPNAQLIIYPDSGHGSLRHSFGQAICSRALGAGPADRPGRGQSPVAASRNASSSAGMSGPLGW